MKAVTLRQVFEKTAGYAQGMTRINGKPLFIWAILKSELYSVRLIFATTRLSQAHMKPTLLKRTRESKQPRIPAGPFLRP